MWRDPGQLLRDVLDNARSPVPDQDPMEIEGAGLLRLLLDQMSEAVYVLDGDQRFRMYNRRFEDMMQRLGLQLEIGLPVGPFLLRAAEYGFFGPGSPAEIANARLAELSDGNYGEHESAWFDDRSVLARKNPLVNGWIVLTVLDITDRKRAEDDLAVKEAQLRRALDNIEGAVLMYDSELNLQVFSRRYMEIGKLPEELFVVGESIMPILRFRAERGDYGEGDPIEIANERAEFLKNIPDGLYQEQPMADGIAEVYWSRDTDGNLISVTNDITQRKELELRHRLAREEANVANRAKSEFLANMSHELRTPLNAILGFSQSLQAGIAGSLNSKQMEYLQDIRDSGDHLLSLINDVLDLSKIEAGKQVVEQSSVSVQGSVVRCLPFVSEQADKGGVILATQIEDDLPSLFVDERMLMQMLVNLLSNAVKFTPRGGTVSVEAKPSEKGCVTLKVRDTGVGMSPHEIPTAMSAFEQTESGKFMEGTGLGLPLVQSLAELNGGSLNLESRPGHGTIASISLPVAEPDPMNG